MSQLEVELREAFEEAGYEVDAVGDNRGQIRVALREPSPDPEELRGIVHEICGEDAVLGFDVTSETTAGDDAVGTVVAFRHRP